MVGIDADARAMAEASRRVARRASPPGPPRVWFVAAGIDRLPADLDGIADRVTVRFPWGSLLRGALGLDPGTTDSIARLVAPAGRLELTLSVTGRDGRSATGLQAGLGPTDLERMAAAFDGLGLDLVELRPLRPADLDGLHSSWARRLRAGLDRPAWRATFVRRPPGSVR